MMWLSKVRDERQENIPRLRNELFNMQSDAQWSLISHHKVGRLSRVPTPRNEEELAQVISM
jgi:hypothetical protein